MDVDSLWCRVVTLLPCSSIESGLSCIISSFESGFMSCTALAHRQMDTVIGSPSCSIATLSPVPFTTS